MTRQQEMIVSRLREAITNGGGYSVVAEKSGIPPASLNRYLKGHEMKISTASRLADVTGVSLGWLVGGETRAHPVIASEPNGPGVGLRYYEETQASAGFGLIGTDAPVPRMVFVSKDFLSELGLTAHHTIILKVSGDSMEPTLKSGDKLFLNTTPTKLLNGITVFVSSGQLMVKRLSPTASSTVRIIADNDRYPTEEAEISRFRWGEPDGGDAITIIGRVAYRLQAMS